MFLIFDTETTGLPKQWNAPITNTENWPRCIQIAWQLHDDMGRCLEHQDYLIRPDGFNIPYDAEKIHGISTELASEQGVPLLEVLELFNTALSKAEFVVGQNVGFDLNIMGCEFHRLNLVSNLNKLPVLDTCTEKTATMCQIPGGRGGKFKLPTLTELHKFLFDKPFGEAHNATADVEATTRCFLELIRRQEFTIEQLKAPIDYFQQFKTINQSIITPAGITHVNLKEQSAIIANRIQQENKLKTPLSISNDVPEVLNDVKVVHLHNHTQFSVLQSTISVKKLVAAASDQQMPAVAITDHGNMMGAFHFVKEIDNYNRSVRQKNKDSLGREEPQEAHEIKGIVGCEFFVCEDHSDKSQKDNGYQVVFLAKTKKGYHNLVKMSSKAYTDGFYYLPRIDRSIVETYKKDLIVLTGNLYGEVPSKILNVGERQAEEALLWWKEKFGADLYVEIMRHQQEDEDRVNPVLISMAQKHEVKLVATNNTYYVNQEDANAHDILLCVKDG
jgi:DNA polymerase-3 subunit alpha